MYTRQQKYTNNNNRQREKRAGGIDSIVIEFYVCMYVQKMFWAKVRAIRILVLQKLQNGFVTSIALKKIYIHFGFNQKSLIGNS